MQSQDKENFAALDWGIALSTDVLTRRAWLRRSAQLAAAIPFAMHDWPSRSDEQHFDGQSSGAKLALPSELFTSDPGRYRFTAKEEAFLEEIERTSFAFFWEQASAVTGQIEDRGPAN